MEGVDGCDLDECVFEVRIAAEGSGEEVALTSVEGQDCDIARGRAVKDEVFDEFIDHGGFMVVTL